jgi:hypothetical protein
LAVGLNPSHNSKIAKSTIASVTAYLLEIKKIKINIDFSIILLSIIVDS